MSIATVLKRARSIIEDEAHWCSKFYAATKEGHVATPGNPLAVRFCAYGAISRAALQLPTEIGNFNKVMHDASVQLYNLDLISVNDRPEFGHKFVLRVFDLAIEMSEKEEAP